MVARVSRICFFHVGRFFIHSVRLSGGIVFFRGIVCFTRLYLCIVCGCLYSGVKSPVDTVYTLIYTLLHAFTRYYIRVHGRTLVVLWESRRATGGHVAPGESRL